jgi:hypothetical protein
MYTSSRSFRVFESICQELLTRLSGETSAEARAFVNEAHKLLDTLDRWRHDLPTQEQRAVVISRVLDLHRAVMDHLTVGSGMKPPHM